MMLWWTFLHRIELNYLELLVIERKVYNNDDITFFSVYSRFRLQHIITLGLGKG